MLLVDPHPRFHRSFLAAAEEYAAEGRPEDLGLPSWPAAGRFPGVDVTVASVRTPEGFAELVGFLLDQRRPEALRPRAYVPFTELWMARGEEYLGRVSMRHELNELLFTWGGHIGYAVRPSARRRGHATAGLRQMLGRCRERGIDPVLLTCDVDNVASRRIIEGAGGEYEDTRQGKRRYWIPLD